MASASRVAVLIPCFNEESTIADVITDFRAALPSAEIYVFDNNSTDRSVNLAIGAGAHVVREPRQGKGYVLQSMFRSVDADVYLIVDGDQTYPAEAAPSLFEPLLGDRADMVVGSRLHRSSASEFEMVNRLGNQFFVALSRLLFGISLTDVLSGYRAFTRDVVRKVKLTSGGFQVETELTIKTVRAGFRIMEVPVNQRLRRPGSRSKLRPWHDGLAILAKMLALWCRNEHS
jgi:glycosyltransferase involved in cell wall biosynthesis